MDVEAELQTYKHSRQGLDEMYNEARRQLREESQLRQVSTFFEVHSISRRDYTWEETEIISSFAFAQFKHCL